jgi:hypothetical protein
VTVDHTCTDLHDIPQAWIDTAKHTLHIGYGHTSHGSQITTGMNALEEYFTDGRFDWSHSGGSGQLHLFEGASYSDGWLDHDCGYAGWDTETRDYLDAHPACNVIIWSWCGQVNGVDLQQHYLTPMSQLESEYPEVTFVYMTGHLEGLGPDGSLYTANQTIRDYCSDNGNVLYDFADIEKYDPDGLVDYQQYYADDACTYTPAGGGSANWADEWIQENPSHELTAITGECGGCAHSRALNCVQKGIAAWWLWARIAGWNGATENVQVPRRYGVRDKDSWYSLHNNTLRIVASRVSGVYTVTVTSVDGTVRAQGSACHSELSLPLPQTSASGVYIVSFRCASFSAVRRVVVQR